MYIYTATHDYVQFKYNNCHSSSGGGHVRSFAWSWTYGLMSVYFSFTNTTPGCIADSLKWWYFRIPESGEKSVDRNVFQSYQQNPSFTTMALFPLADFWTTFARSWSESLSALQRIYQVFIYKSYTYSSLHDSIHFERMNGHVRK